jgi:hypothetical protein
MTNLIQAKKISCKKWLVLKKLEYKIAHTALTIREMRRRHRTSLGKLVTHLEQQTYRTQPKV